MHREDLDLRDDVSSGQTARWVDVQLIARSVDRQLECLRSILVTGDPMVVEGPLGDLVRDTAGYVATHRPPRSDVSRPGPVVALVEGQVVRNLTTVSSLAARVAGPGGLGVVLCQRDDDPDVAMLVEVLSGLLEEITSRYHRLVRRMADVGSAFGIDPEVVASATPSTLLADEAILAAGRTTGDLGFTRAAGLVLSSVLAIGGLIGETCVWVECRHLRGAFEAEQPEGCRA